jgi:hypothetical protein
VLTVVRSVLIFVALLFSYAPGFAQIRNVEIEKVLDTSSRVIKHPQGTYWKYDSYRLQSTVDGNTWSEQPWSGFASVSFFMTKNGWLFLSSLPHPGTSGEFHFSFDGGTTWLTDDDVDGPSFLGTWTQITRGVVDGDGGLYLFGDLPNHFGGSVEGNRGLFYSPDSLKTLTWLADGSHSGTMGGPLIGPENGLYYSVSGSSLLWARNKGVLWERYTTPCIDHSQFVYGDDNGSMLVYSDASLYEWKYVDGTCDLLQTFPSDVERTAHTPGGVVFLGLDNGEVYMVEPEFRTESHLLLNSTWVGNVQITSSNYLFVSTREGAYQSTEPIEPVTNTSVHRSEDLETNAFEVWPNPTSSKLNIRWPRQRLQEMKDIRVVDMLGRTVLTSQFNTPETQLDTSRLAAGLYLVKIDSETGGASKLFSITGKSR